MFLSSHSPELRQLSTTDLKFLEEGLDGPTNAFCDLDTILDDFQADHHILLTNPNQLLNGNHSDCIQTKANKNDPVRLVLSMACPALIRYFYLLFQLIDPVLEQGMRV